MNFPNVPPNNVAAQVKECFMNQGQSVVSYAQSPKLTDWKQQSDYFSQFIINQFAWYIASPGYIDELL